MGYINGNGERALYVNPGVNDWLEFSEIDLNYAADTEFLHLTSFVGEKPFLAQKKLVKTLSDVKVSFDPGALYTKKGLDALKPIITRCYVMFPTSKELKMLTGQDYQIGSESLIQAGVEIVAVKLGNKGCYVTNGQQRYLVEPYKKKVVDTTGAGDAFCAGFLFGLITGRDLLQCGRIGNFVASLCISKVGARTGLPSFKDLDTFF
jgi:ribokinase